MSKPKKIISSLIQLRDEIERLIGDALDEASIYNILSSSAYNISEEICFNKEELKAKVKTSCAEYKPYSRIQRVVTNQLIMPLNRRKWFIWDEENYRTYETDKETIIKEFNKKQDYLRNSEHISVSYVPKNKYGLTKHDYKTIFNSYKAPNWLEPIYRYGKPVPVVTEVPDLYHRFLMHLVAGDVASYDYVLDWLAISLQYRNETFLVTIGSAGIGKGFLSKIIRALHGYDHFVEAPFSDIGSQFTGLFNEKTAIYLNELSKMSAKEYAMLKQANDDYRKNELKGVDAESVPNHANYYISSNNMDAIPADSNERRLSIINLTTKRLEDSMSQEDIHKLAPKKGDEFTWLNDFGYYLLQRKYNPQWLVKRFESEQTKRISDASAYDWEKWIIESFCKDFAGRIITCRAVSEFMSPHFPKLTITEKSLRSLSDKFRGIFTVVKTEVYEELAFINNKPNFKISDNPNNKRLRCIEILPLAEQTNHEIREVEND